VCNWDENSKFARDMNGAHVVFMHGNVIERCADNLADRQCRGHVWTQRGRRGALGDSCMYGGEQR